MISIQALREQRNALAKQAADMYDAKGDRVWESAESERFFALGDHVEALDNEIKTLEKLHDSAAADRFSDGRFDPSAADIKRWRPERQPDDPNGNCALFNKYMREGMRAMTADELGKIRAAMSTTTGSEGGFTVQTEVATELIKALKAFGGMRTVARQLTTSQGNPMSFPTQDATSEVGEWIPENGSATALDPSFGTVALNVFKASSKSVGIPFELLQDSQIDMVAMINDVLMTRIARTMNIGFTTGSGTGQPRGVVTAASSGKVGTTGQTTTVLFDDLVDLQESIDFAYQQSGNCVFMMHQQTRKVVRKLKDTQGRPIWVDSWDAGATQGVAGQLLGQNVVINNDMAQPAANARSILYGDFSKYLIRDVMDITMFRFEDSAYIIKGQYGFLAWARAGANLLDANAVKFYQHSAT